MVSAGYDDRYDPDTDFDRWFTFATGERIAAAITPGQTVLELGCATGLMTTMLLHADAQVTAVDRSTAYLARASARAPDATFFFTHDVATSDLRRQFDHVVAANIAHEIPDLPAFLAMCRAHLSGLGSRVHVTIPNPRSLHRRLGLAMGLIDALDEQSARGEQYETVRLLSANAFTDVARAAGLRCVHHGGIMVKPFPNDLMATLPDDVLRGLVALAEDLPELCAMNYLVFRPS